MRPLALGVFGLGMEASAVLLEELGVDPLMTRSTVERLRRVFEEGVPEPPLHQGTGR